MKKTITTSFFLLLAATLSLTFSGCQEKKETKQKNTIVKVVTVQKYGEVPDMTFPGKVRPADDAKLSFRISGPIKEIHVKEGSRVKKGELLAKMDDRDYQIQFSATEAEFKQVKAEAERVISLYNKGSVSENDYDKAVYGLQQITAKYNAHKNALDDTRLTAPFDGYVKNLVFQAGETIGAGMPVISIVSSDAPEIEINIPASEFILRNRFESFTAEVEVYPGIIFNMDLISINPSANLNQLYKTRLKLQKRSDGIMPTVGMTALVTIHYTPETTGEVSVPVEAVAAENGQSYTWIYNDSKVNRRNVTVTKLTSDGKAVISNGLNAGEQVVSAGVALLKENQEVKLLPQSSNTNKGNLL